MKQGFQIAGSRGLTPARGPLLFSPISLFVRFFVLELGARSYATDGQTDGRTPHDKLIMQNTAL